MGIVCIPQIQRPFQVETKGLLLLVVIMFVSGIVLLQSSGLPYKTVILSILSAKSVPVGELGSPDGSNYNDSSVVLHAEANHSKGPEELLVKDKNNILPDHAEFPDDGVEFNDKDIDLEMENDTIGKSDLAPIISPTNLTWLRTLVPNVTSMDFSTRSNTSSATETISKDEKPVVSQSGSVILNKNSEKRTDHVRRRHRKTQPISISQMHSLLHQNRASYSSLRLRWPSKRDQELLYVKSQIENAPILRSHQELDASIYQNISMFKRSYELMEHILKVYVYGEGEKPVFHEPDLRGIYASEGWFMKMLEGNKHFIVNDPRKAHLFYLPFSSKVLRYTVSRNNLSKFLKNYVELIATKYSFWNGTDGADHFLVACHDWAPQITVDHMGTCIRALCNANVARGFKLGYDVSLPVTYVRVINDPLKSLGGKTPSKRPILAFFAGRMHGYLRTLLLQHWENKDPDMKIFGPINASNSGNMSYLQYMKSSKYCICAKGYEVHTPRVVEAIFHECVPVIISDNYVPPFFEILNWDAFSVFVAEKDVPNLKSILISIPWRKYLKLQQNVKKVQRHFLWHPKPVNDSVLVMLKRSTIAEGRSIIPKCMKKPSEML